MSSAHQVGAAYRRAADYVAASVIFLRGNVLLREPLRPEHIKALLTVPDCPNASLAGERIDWGAGRQGRRGGRGRSRR
ncbi:hypothetical protein [Streptomyces sp. NPDC056464]|uniref:hypothetical protein n=1 Tax=Streptomyces sp. NPDC056464 TaxID=3345828 RepID=UPI00369F872A